VNPITYALFCYPQGWIRSLAWIDSLGPSTIIPGHGAPLHDEILLHATLSLLRRERELGQAAHEGGAPVDQAKATILADPEVQRLRATITGGDPKQDGAFGVYLVDWFVRRVYEEAAKPLDDSIPQAP